MIQVKPKGESKFITAANDRLLQYNVQLFWPRRSLRIRRRGYWKNTLAPIFPGYIFMQAEGINADMYWRCRKIPGFSHFLRSNDHIIPLSARDQDLLQHFVTFGQIVDKSLVHFDKDKRIQIVSGPLKGLEGLIVKVNRRKGRAKVRLDLYEESFFIDFGFEDLDHPITEEKPGQGDAAIGHSARGHSTKI